MNSGCRNAKDASPETYRPMSKAPTIVRRGSRIASADDVYRYLSDLRDIVDREHLVVLDLDVRHRLIERRTVHIGTLTEVLCHPRDVFRAAILNCAAALIVVHNHPSGDPTPSRQDIELTTRLRDAGELLGIPLLDHVIVASDGYTSCAERGWR